MPGNRESTPEVVPIKQAVRRRIIYIGTPQILIDTWRTMMREYSSRPQ